MTMNKENVALVTGGAGFIGSHLVEHLLADGHKVVVLDNFSGGKMENLDRVKDNPRLTINRADVTNYSEIKKFFNGVRWVFHLAALADIVPSIQHPLKYHAANVDGTISVLEAARKAGVKRFVYAASSSCYGIPDEFPTPEEAPSNPMYPYALTKYLGEQYVLHWEKVYKLPCVSLRLFNVYGPRARTSGTYGAVFGVFLAQKLNGKPFTVVGDGTQKRDFTFVTDAVRAFIGTVKSDIQGEILNVGSGNTYTVNSLVNLLRGDVIYIPKRPGEPDCTFADIRKIKRVLNWHPRVNFEEGIRIMLQNIREWSDSPLWSPEAIEEATKEWFECLREQ